MSSHQQQSTTFLCKASQPHLLFINDSVFYSPMCFYCSSLLTGAMDSYTEQGDIHFVGPKIEVRGPYGSWTDLVYGSDTRNRITK